MPDIATDNQRIETTGKILYHVGFGWCNQCNESILPKEKVRKALHQPGYIHHLICRKDRNLTNVAERLADKRGWTVEYAQGIIDDVSTLTGVNLNIS